MSTELLTGDVWTRLGRANRKARGRAWVAVAYFSKGAARLLNLKKGSQLVVNASENAVKSGQTCPNDLILLVKKGVRIFSDRNLHAKVYVFGNTTFIGSANVSRHSAKTLVETMLVTTDRKIVQAAKEFVKSIAKNEIGPDQLEILRHLYRDPKWPLGGAGRKPVAQNSVSRVAQVPIRLVQLDRIRDYSEREQAETEAGYKVARRRRKQRSWSLEEFVDADYWPQKYPKSDKVVMVTTEPSGREFIDPPGNVLHVRAYPVKNGTGAVVFLEVPKRRRRALNRVAKQIGRGTVKSLRRRGLLRRDISSKLNDIFLKRPH